MAIKEFDFHKRFKSNPIGYCSICNEFKPLSFDHIPPESCGNKNVNIIDYLNQNIQKKSPKGLRFRTICHDCNQLLGRYDQELSKICKDYNSYVDSTLALEGKIKFIGDIENLKKCIIGHVLAGFDEPNLSNNINMKEKGELKKVYREYILNNSPFPDSLAIHYFIHSFDSIMFNPCFSYIADYKVRDSAIVCSLLKFKPFGFIIADYSSTNYAFPLPELSSSNHNYYYLYYKNSLFLKENYPFNVSQNSILMFNNGNLYYGKKIIKR